MGDTGEDPIDHHRTTRPHAGVSMKNTAAMPGLILVAFSVVAFVGCLAGFATRNFDTAVVCIGVAAIAAVTASAWLYAQRRRVRSIKQRWLNQHPGAQPIPPDS